MQNEMQRWFELEGVRFLSGVGLQPNDRVLDFGCGDGVYSIPAAKLVGKEGVVFALDRDRHGLKKVMEKVEAFGISNIVTVHHPNELKRLLHGTFLDVVLLYDVIHSFYFTQRERARLIASISPMIRTEGLVSIFPRHMERDEICTITLELRERGFLMLEEKTTNLMHDGKYTCGYTIQFKKIGCSDAENESV